MSESSDNLSEQSAPSLGQILTQAREALQLSTQDIASQLYLSDTVIRNIENDQLDNDISPLFSKGYIKSYAKVVGVSQELALQLFEQHYQACCATEKMQSFSQRTKAQIHNNYLNGVTLLILFGFVVMLVIWWYQQRIDTVTEQLALVEQTTPNVSLNASDLNAIVPVLTPVLQIDPGANNIDFDDVIDGATTVLEQLEFGFESNCWVKVTDASNEVLATGRKQAGLNLVISGVAPFEINLGQPCAASISYQGQLLDITPYITGNTARFIVPME